MDTCAYLDDYSADQYQLRIDTQFSADTVSVNSLSLSGKTVLLFNKKIR